MGKKTGPSPDTQAGTDTGTTPKPEETPPSTQSDLEKDVSRAISSATPPSENAIEAAGARERAESEVVDGKGKGKGAGQAGKKRGPYGAGKAPRTGTTVSTLSQESEEAVQRAYRQIGYSIADTLIIGGVTLGGSDWNPVRQSAMVDGKETVVVDERENLRNAWADMAEYYKWEKFPPWLGVTLATASYVGPRLMAPSTQARFSKLKSWWHGWQAKRQEKAARVVDRPNGEVK